MKFGNAGGYSSAYFDECFAKFGISEGMEYGGGVSTSDYEHTRENILKVANKESMIQKYRGTATSETATGTTYSTTSGSIPTLIPIYVSPDIINLSQKNTPLVAMLPKIAVRGKTYDWNKGQFPSTYARFLPEDSGLDVYDDTYVRSSIPMKYLYAVGRVSGPMQVLSSAYINMERQEIMMKTRGMFQKLEEEIISGSVSDDPDGFDGLKAQISTNSTTLSAAISISAIRTSILHARQGAETWSETIGGGNPDLIITNLQSYDDIKALLQAYLRYNDTTQIAWGLVTYSFEGIPVLASTMMTTTSGSKEIFVIDTAFVKLGTALDITFERLAKTNDSNKFMLKWYGALIVLNERACAEILTIT